MTEDNSNLTAATSDSSRPPSSFVKKVDRQIFTVELRHRETTIVSWKKLVKDANKVNNGSFSPTEQLPKLNPALDSLFKSKLYRFDKDGNQWKERGVGTVKFLKHKATGKVRLLMRQSKTLKICTNHLNHAGNEKSCGWHARDFADGELKDEFFCICFSSIENQDDARHKFGQSGGFTCPFVPLLRMPTPACIPINSYLLINLGCFIQLCDGFLGADALNCCVDFVLAVDNEIFGQRR